MGGGEKIIITVFQVGYPRISPRISHTNSLYKPTTTSHVTCTRRAHQIIASSLHLLLQKAYAEYSEDIADAMSLEDWTAERAAACPLSQFWHVILLVVRVGVATPD